MTCERGLKDYMICTECHSVFTQDAIEIGEMFNCASDTALVCSEKCERKIIDKVQRGDWMNFEGYSAQIETISE